MDILDTMDENNYVSKYVVFQTYENEILQSPKINVFFQNIAASFNVNINWNNNNKLRL